MDWHPEPIDVAEVELGPELEALGERLARNVHAIWARMRLDEGWRYGPERDDARREHPCLVPFEDLPESEKAYDRGVALGTLRAIVALGFHLGPER